MCMRVCAECKHCVPDNWLRRLCCSKHVYHITGAPELCAEVRGDGRCHDGWDWEPREDGGKVSATPEVPHITHITHVTEDESGWPAALIISGSIVLGFILGWGLV